MAATAFGRGPRSPCPAQGRSAARLRPEASRAADMVAASSVTGAAGRRRGNNDASRGLSHGSEPLAPLHRTAGGHVAADAGDPPGGDRRLPLPTVVGPP